MLYNYNRTLEQRWEDVYSSCHEESEGILLWMYICHVQREVELMENLMLIFRGYNPIYERIDA
jgi:hypothetical protein